MNKRKLNKVGADTVIGKNTKISGNLEFIGNIVVDGKVTGNIDSSVSKVSSMKGVVVVGTNGEVEGNINADKIVVSGYVEGNLKADSTVELLEDATVKGDIDTRSIIVDQGANFNGICIMTEPEKTKSSLFEPGEETTLEEVDLDEPELDN